MSSIIIPTCNKSNLTEVIPGIMPGNNFCINDSSTNKECKYKRIIFKNNLKRFLISKALCSLDELNFCEYKL